MAEMKPDQMPGANQDAGGIPVYPADSPSPEGTEPPDAAWTDAMDGGTIYVPSEGAEPRTVRQAAYEQGLADGRLIEQAAARERAALPEPSLDVERLADAAWKDYDPKVNGFVVDNILDMRNLLDRWLAEYRRLGAEKEYRP